MSYYENSAQWPAGTPGSGGGQVAWDQTPPVRSGASSAVPREEIAGAFSNQIEEVDRAIDNLVKSGKMFGMGNRRRMGANANTRPPSMADYGDSRGGHPPSNLQNYYTNQRHQSSRGSNEAEQMMQAKRRMAAQRERELRNYHQEQQYNRTMLAELTYSAGGGGPSASGGGSSGNGKPDRALSPGNMSEDDRRELIARQRSALYREGPFAETGGYVDETGASRPGLPGTHGGPHGSLRSHSPLAAYEYGRPPPVDTGAQGSADGEQGSQSAGGAHRSRANSSSSPQSNPSGAKGVFDVPGAGQPSSRTSNSSPGGSPSTKSGPGSGAVAPIGTRPQQPGSAQGAAPNPALNKRSTTPLPSPLSHSVSAPGGGDGLAQTATTGGSNPPPAGPEGSVAFGWGGRSGVWGNGKSGLGMQASVWG